MRLRDAVTALTPSQRSILTVGLAVLLVSSMTFPFVATAQTAPDGCGDGDIWAESAEAQTSFGMLTWGPETVQFGGEGYRGWVVHAEENSSQAIQSWANASDDRTIRRSGGDSNRWLITAPAPHVGLGVQLSLVVGQLRKESYVECIGVARSLSVRRIQSRDLASQDDWEAPPWGGFATSFGLEGEFSADGHAFGDEVNATSLAEFRSTVGADRVSANGTGQRIAVIDSGMVYDEEDYQDRIVAGANVIGQVETLNQSANYTNRSYSILEDNNGHGSHVLATVGADGGGPNSTGIAPNASLIPIKALNAEGSGKTTDIAQGLEYACDPARGNADIVSMSLGSPIASSAISQEIDECLSENGSATAVVVANGNSRWTYRYLASPASDMRTISVAASDARALNRSEIAYFSNVAPHPETEARTTLSAPGLKITAHTPRGGNVTLSGTSMAAPGVAGMSALVLETHPSLEGKPEQFRAQMTEHARPIPRAGVTETGHGRLSAYAVTDTQPRGTQEALRNDTAVARDEANRAGSGSWWRAAMQAVGEAV